MDSLKLPKDLEAMLTPVQQQRLNEAKASLKELRFVSKLVARLKWMVAEEIVSALEELKDER